MHISYQVNNPKENDKLKDDLYWPDHICWTNNECSKLGTNEWKREYLWKM